MLNAHLVPHRDVQDKPDSALGNTTVLRALTRQVHGYDVTELGSEQASALLPEKKSTAALA